MSPSRDQAFIDALAERLRAQQRGASEAREPNPKTNGHRTLHRPLSLVRELEQTDEQVIAACRGAENSQKFSDLFDRGDVHTYHGGDDSAADLGLMGMMRFWTQDPAQLERLFSASELGKRNKWTQRHDYRARTIGEALRGNFEVYDWYLQRSRPLLSSSLTPLGVSNDDDNNGVTQQTGVEKVEVVWFSKLGEPKEREFLIEQIGVKGYPIVAFGAGGVAKSFAMLSAGIAIASEEGVDKWLGLQILEHGHVLYLDFELDPDEQHRRVRDLCAGMGVPIPDRLAYISGVGILPETAFRAALAHVKEYGALAVIIDSMGLAMQGDMEKGKDVLAFHSRNINPLRRAGATPFIVDHEGKLQSGEKHKDKSPFGSAYKAWASRSVLQFELDEFDKTNSALHIRVRQTKTNFGPKVEPIGLKITFGEKKVSMDTFELPDVELIEEESKPVRDRILGALEIGSGTNNDLQRLTGASAGTIRNNLSQLIQEGLVVEEGHQGRQKVYALLSSSLNNSTRPSDDDNKPETVAALFASPPNWLATQLRVYWQDPDRHFKPLCTAVAAVVLGDGNRRPEVIEEVMAALEQPPLG